MNKLIRSWDAHLGVVLGLLITSNAYFVQRVISRVDLTIGEISALREQVARIETRLDLQDEAEKKVRWKKSLYEI